MTEHAASGPCNCGLRGWLPGIIHIPAREHGYRGVPAETMQATAVVMHVAQGYIRTIDDWARSPEIDGAMPHFGVDVNGVARQYVSIFEPAWHAGRLDREQPTIARFRGVNPNLQTVGIELEGFSGPRGWMTGGSAPWFFSLPVAARLSAAELVRWTNAQHGITPRLHDSLIGHHEIAPTSREYDPGPAFPWEEFLKMVQPKQGTTFPPPITGRDRSILNAIFGERFVQVQPMERTDDEDRYILRLRREWQSARERVRP